MKPLKYIAVALGLVTLSLSSCNDFLDKDPDERTTIFNPNNPLDTERKVVYLLSSSYPASNYAWVGELSSDNLIDNNAPHLPALDNLEQVVSRLNLSPYGREDDEIFRFEPVKSSKGQDTPAHIWESYYYSIATANYALEAIEKLEKMNYSSAKLSAAKGEALLVRAYSHFILVNVFSQAYKDEELSKKDVGIPYSTKPETHLIQTYSRGNVAEVYANIEKDLEEGLKNISDINYTKPKWHFNTNAAHAFAARFYLFKRNWDKVIEHANAVLGNPVNSSLLMNYSTFHKKTTGLDFAEVWQGPNVQNNLMLIDTYSLFTRRVYGNRYSQNGDALKNIVTHRTPFWPNWAINPIAGVSGMLFGDVMNGYGAFSSKMMERFEYADKIGKTGYVHVIRREFTATKLLLERAEAYAMKGEYDKAYEDILTYYNMYKTMHSEDIAAWVSNNRMRDMTKEMFLAYYSDPKSPNCFENWNFVSNMSPSYTVPAEAVPYMNAVNYWRRFEFNLEGNRFFDLKRWGIEYSHFYGPQNQEIRLTWNDPRRAIEVPQDVLSAGLESSQPLVQSQPMAKDAFSKQSVTIRDVVSNK